MELTCLSMKPEKPISLVKTKAKIDKKNNLKVGFISGIQDWLNIKTLISAPYCIKKSVRFNSPSTHELKSIKSFSQLRIKRAFHT